MRASMATDMQLAPISSTWHAIGVATEVAQSLPRGNIEHIEVRYVILI